MCKASGSRWWKPPASAATSRPKPSASWPGRSFWFATAASTPLRLPGGFVGVHLGLIAATGSTDELAAVLAHELSHVTQRHIARRIVSAKQTTLLSTAAMILGVLAASKAGSGDGVQAAVAGSQAANMQAQLNFSRDMEREADRVGFGVLTDAGYASAGMAGMFDKLELASRMNDTGSFPYLRSHPLTIERISEARARAVASPAGQAEDPLNHRLMGARSRVLMDGQIQSLRRLQDRLGNNPLIAVASLPLDERLPVLYGGAFAASQLREGEPAKAAVSQGIDLLDKQQPANPAAQRSFLLLDAQLTLQRGDAAGAMRVLDTAALQPPSRAALLLRAQAALGVARGAGADASAKQSGLHRCAEDLQSWVALHRDDALAWELLGQCDHERGEPLRSLRAQAEARAALGDIAGAIDRLRAAQALVRAGGSQDHIEASVIDARQRQLMALQRELNAALRGGSAGQLAPGAR